MNNILKSEKIILSNINLKYKWIARDENGDLNLYLTKPTKSVGKGYWESDEYYQINIFDNLFLWITWQDKEPVKICDIINN